MILFRPREEAAARQILLTSYEHPREGEGSLGLEKKKMEMMVDSIRVSIIFHFLCWRLPRSKCGRQQVTRSRQNLENPG